jgi:uncharacterized protein involved in type VI secretion and phage assembly
MQRENGIVIGLVDDLDDPENLGRVRVRYPCLGGERSTWARLVTPMGGKNRGLFLRPEKEDEVFVAFEQGEPRRPYILGSLWSQEDPPPKDDGNQKKNNWRFIRSRSGHLLKFDDTDGAERIEIIDKTGQHSVTIDASGKKISIVCGDGNIEINAPAGKLSVDAKEISLNASQSMSITTKGPLTISGQTVAIN